MRLESVEQSEDESDAEMVDAAAVNAAAAKDLIAWASSQEAVADDSEFEGDYWKASREATRGIGINVRKTPCTSSSILGTVWPGDSVLASRERSGSWMELIYWEEQRACWVFRGDEDDLFQWEGFCDRADYVLEKERWKRKCRRQELTQSVPNARRRGGGSPMIAAWTTRSKGAVGSV